MLITETERLILTELMTEDASFMLELLNSPGWLEHIGDRGVRTVEEADAYIRKGPMASYAENGFGLYLVKRQEDDASLGICGLINREGLDGIDIGFGFLPQYAGYGYAFEAAKAVMELAEERFGLTHVLAITSQDNERSIHLLKKLGFSLKELIKLPNDDEKLNLFIKNLEV